ncbi:Undecaprenyl-phosphate galactose phosphotransferase [Planctomycetales bacterium 10988]|nr:Undecaprenyl-phosphate galactose phosphotransferase [Planctomycetales bacterium 10988]
MYRRHGQKLAWVFLGSDLAVTAGSWFAAYGVRYSLWEAPQGIPDLGSVAGLLPIVLGLAAFSYTRCKFYDIHRLQKLPQEAGLILKASGLLAILIIAAVFCVKDVYFSRLAYGLFFLINAGLLLLWRRLAWSLLIRLRERGLNQGRAAVLGSGRLARNVVKTLQANRWTALEVQGVIDDERPETLPGSIPYLGTLKELPKLIQKHDLDHLFFALPLKQYGELDRITRSLADCQVELQMIPDMPQWSGMHLRTWDLEGMTFLSLREIPQQRGLLRWKRGLDFLLASLALVILSPSLALIALLVKVSSNGPIFYRQTRTTWRGQDFEMLKFRTMRVDAEQQTGAVWAKKGDPRCTAIGKVLRSTSLDELPQLWNVVRGEMSLVGPRPERPVFIEKFRQEIPHYHWRHQVKAGITGWAQVHGWRGNTSLRKRIEYDLYYVNHWSLWLDLKILMLTIWRGFYHPHAG